MKKEELRIRRLEDLLLEKERVSIHEAVERLEVSEATVRRLFSNLEKQGKLLRIHGGVCRTRQSSCEYSYDQSKHSFVAEKELIGIAAAAMVKNSAMIFLDSGTTVLQAAKALASRLTLGELENIRIVTNSIICQEILATLCPLTLTGGLVRPKRHDLCGNNAEQTIEQYNFDMALLGADSINIRGELLTTDEQTAAMNRRVLLRSREVLLLTDSSKFYSNSYIIYGRINASHFTLITDKQPPDSLLKYLEQQQVKIYLPDDGKNRKNKNFCSRASYPRRKQRGITPAIE